MRRFIQERTMFKLLVEKTGLLFSVTTHRRAYFFFLSTRLFGIRTAPTTDPYPGIVEVCGYDIPTIVDEWNRLSNLIVRKPKSELRK